MKKNGFTPVLILIIIAILGVVGYFAYKSYQNQQSDIVQTDTSSQLATPNVAEAWKTYTNKDAGFSVQYPADFDSINNTSNMASFESVNGYNLGLLDFEVVELSKYQSQIDMIKEDLDSGNPSVRHQEISGRDVYLESQQSSGSIFERNIFIVNGGSVVHIRVSADDEKVPNVIDKVEKLADEILSTFKFTK